MLTAAAQLIIAALMWVVLSGIYRSVVRTLHAERQRQGAGDVA